MCPYLRISSFGGNFEDSMYEESCTRVSVALPMLLVFKLFLEVWMMYLAKSFESSMHILLCLILCHSQLEQKAVFGRLWITEISGVVTEHTIYYLQ